MTLEDCRRALHSEAPIVAVEAAAGCGKTYEAAALALQFAGAVKEHQEVLLLAHTHAAINVFRERIGKRARVRVMTLDAFAHEAVKPYAEPLGLPAGLRFESAGRVPFEKLAPAVCELLRRAPAVRAAMASHYPVVLLDEHQDARPPQHDVVLELSRAGSKVRFFGDPMQAIYDFGDAPAADWGVLVRDANEVKSLLEPRRWPDAARLGEWLVRARQDLLHSRRLPRLVPEVMLHVTDEQFEPAPHSRRAPQFVGQHAFRLLNRLNGSVAFLVRTRAHAVGLRRALARRVPVFEGRSVLQNAAEFVDEALVVSGDACSLARLAIQVLGRVSAGVDAAMKARVERCVLPQGIDRRRQSKMLPVLDILARLYDAPTVVTWCAVMGTLAVTPPAGVSIDDAGALHVLGRLASIPSDDALHEALAELGHKLALRRPPRRCITTIHIAKGDEFDHVVVPHFGVTSFPNTFGGAKLLYVAATRARRSLHLLAPRGAPSPLAPENQASSQAATRV